MGGPNDPKPNPLSPLQEMQFVSFKIQVIHLKEQG